MLWRVAAERLSSNFDHDDVAVTCIVVCAGKVMKSVGASDTCYFLRLQNICNDDEHTYFLYKLLVFHGFKEFSH
jgi:hypothetical protein